MAEKSSPHADHDPLVVASLLDDDLSDPERALAEARIDECAECAALHRDLMALSVATRTQPAPARPRDFRLTPADAARLRAEPVATSPRLTGVMTELPATSAHRTHDTTLVASLVDHSLTPAERIPAEALVASCSDCATLHADLMTLVAATRAMPTPPRPADYTLTPADAARLRGSRWRRFVAAIGSSRDGFSRPLAVGLTTLGLVGVLFASVPAVLQSPGATTGSATSNQGGEASQPVIKAAPGAITDTAGNSDAGAAPTSAAAAARSALPDRAASSAAPVLGAAIPPAAGTSGVPEASTQPETNATGTGAAIAPTAGAPTDAASTADLTVPGPASGADPLLVVSAVFLLVGLGLFILRWSARRLNDG